MNIDLKTIKWNQPKYILPTIIYLTGLMVINPMISMFTLDTSDRDMVGETTDYINPKIPDASIRGDGIGDRRSNLEKTFGNVTDLTAIDNIEEEEAIGPEEYESKYTDDELAQLEGDKSQQELDAMLAELDRQAQEAQANAQKTTQSTQPSQAELAQQQQQEALAEMQRILSQQLEDYDKVNNPSTETPAVVTENTEVKVTEEKANAVTVPDEMDEATTVVKKVNAKNDYFNTLAENDPQPNLIKAIIDEDIKAVDGSRVRLRLLDDIDLDGVTVKKGTYIYATMSGFGGQRVTGNINTMLVNDNIVKVNLRMYDMDGLEGLYVPQSSFRETSKEIAGSAMGQNVNIGSSYNNSMQQWGIQSLQNAISRSTQALSSAIKKNRAKLKYGTQVYLVNGRVQ